MFIWIHCDLTADLNKTLASLRFAGLTSCRKPGRYVYCVPNTERLGLVVKPYLVLLLYMDLS